MQHNLALLIDPQDNVATAFVPLSAGSSLTLSSGAASYQITLLDAIPAGHKFAVTRISKNTEILKYGACIGKALNDILAGTHVHLHNLESLRGRGDKA